MALIGGSNFKSTVYNIMNSLLRKNVACTYSLQGKRGKMPFNKLNLYNVVTGMLYVLYKIPVLGTHWDHYAIIQLFI